MPDQTSVARSLGRRAYGFASEQVGSTRCGVRSAQRADPTNFRSAKISSSQRFDPVKQIFFTRDAGDLIAQLAILEKEQSRDRANVVF